MPVFGPVPSRRLGVSLGINNIPPKHCTYSCVYCQLGRTSSMTAERRYFYPPAGLAVEAGRKLDKLAAAGVRPDYLTFVPDGEPTLDVNLGMELELLKKHGIKTCLLYTSPSPRDRG